MSYLVENLPVPIESVLAGNECMIFALHHVKDNYLMFSCMLKDGKVYSKVPFNRFGKILHPLHETQPWPAEDSHFEIKVHPFLEELDNENLRYILTIHQERVTGGDLGVNTLHLLKDIDGGFGIYPNHYCEFHHGRWTDNTVVTNKIETLRYE